MSDRRGAPLVSVVIPTFNRATTLRRCLDRLACQTAIPGTFEVVVADDASTDDTGRVVSDWATTSSIDVRYARCEKGFAGAARNRGAELARGERVLFLGDDILATPDLVEQHLLMSARYGDRGVFVGSVVLDGPRPLPPFMSFLEESGVHHDFPTLRTYGDRQIPGRYFYACNASLPRRALTEVGGFDESIQRAWEDSELGCRLASAGWPLRFAPLARGVHVHPQDLVEYVGFLRRGRDDVARAACVMRSAGEEFPAIVSHPLLDRLVGDRVIAAVVHGVNAVDTYLPKGLRNQLYRRLIRYERRRALQRACPS